MYWMIEIWWESIKSEELESDCIVTDRSRVQPPFSSWSGQGNHGAIDRAPLRPIWHFNSTNNGSFDMTLFTHSVS